MKKVLLYLILLLINGFTFGQNITVTHDSLLLENKIYFLKSTHTPYTGTAVSWNNGKKVIETQYVNGKVDGVEILFFANGTIETKSEYKEGKFNGTMTSYFSNGNLKSTEIYVNDYKNGKSVYYYPFGGKEKEGNYENCFEVGKWIFWNEAGQKVSEKEYKMGELVKEMIFESNQ